MDSPGTPITDGGVFSASCATPKEASIPADASRAATDQFFRFIYDLPYISSNHTFLHSQKIVTAPGGAVFEVKYNVFKQKITEI